MRCGHSKITDSSGIGMQGTPLSESFDYEIISLHKDLDEQLLYNVYMGQSSSLLYKACDTE